MTEETERINNSLRRVKTACKVASVTVLVILVLFCLFMLIFLGLYIFSSLNGNGESSSFSELDPFAVMRIILLGVIAISILIVFRLILLEVTKGHSPFTKVQMRRMRIISLILLIYAVGEALLSPGFTSLFQSAGSQVSYHYTSATDVISIPINLGALCASAGIFCLSLVFEYGVLLQKQSDETL